MTTHVVQLKEEEKILEGLGGFLSLKSAQDYELSQSKCLVID